MTPPFTTDPAWLPAEARELIEQSLYLAEAEGWAYFLHMGDVARMVQEARG